MTGKPLGPDIERPCTHKTHHPHGVTAERYKYDLCRCRPCRAANTREQAHRRRQIAYGRWSRWGSPVGVQRRLQALAWNGWSSRDIANRLGSRNSDVRRWRDCPGERIHARSAERVAAVYDELCMVPAPFSAVSQRVRARARRLGYSSPLAWDDETIDSPDARPHGTRQGVWGERKVS